MAVWANLQEHTSIIMTRNYFDDSTTLCNSTQDVASLLEADFRFDLVSGQCVSESTSIVLSSSTILHT